MSRRLISFLLICCFYTAGETQLKLLHKGSNYIVYNFILDCIDCFKCISINHDYKPCEDPFHNNHTTDILHSPCMGGRKGRDGVFPATSCVKITGVFGIYTFKVPLEIFSRSIEVRKPNF